MKRKSLIVLMAVECCVLLALLGLAAWLELQTRPTAPAEPSGDVTAAVTDAIWTQATVLPPETQPTQTLPPETQPPTTQPPTTLPPETEPQPVEYRLTFAGDCTLGTLYELYGVSSCFPAVVGEDYGYPFRNVQPWFGSDDFTMVNLEGPLTDEGTPADKTYVFRGDPELAQILSEGSVEFVSLANNHSEDFGPVGYENTQKALDAVGVRYAGNGDSALFETERGLKIGVFAVAFYVDRDYMASQLASLREQGAEIVIASFHWGIEGAYHHGWDQEDYAHGAIDAGADIVFGHHPHVLQEVEQYEGGVIFYSMGNFSFGGNDHPGDYDTALISQQVIREPDGTVRLGDTDLIPCSISSGHPNNYQPTPAQRGSERYSRVMEKLSGTFQGPDLS